MAVDAELTANSFTVAMVIRMTFRSRLQESSSRR